MKAFFRSMAGFKHLGSADILSYNLCLDSSDGQASTVVAVGEFARTLMGQWLIIGGKLYLIDRATPQDGRTQFTLLEPEEAFSRPLIYKAPDSYVTAGEFLTSTIQREFIEQADVAYAMPYLSVSSLDTIAFIEPAVDNNGCFSLVEHIRLLRQLSDLRCSFTIEGNYISLDFFKGSTNARNIVFGSGHTQLLSAAYSKSGLAKITVLQPQDSGNVDTEGKPIMVNVYTDFYLAEDGTVSQTVPAKRAEGEWTIISVSANNDPLEKVRQSFAKNKASHKVEFYSDRDLQVFDPCTIALHGDLLVSFISYKGKSSTDSRYLYRSGELATKASQKLRSVITK